MQWHRAAISLMVSAAAATPAWGQAIGLPVTAAGVPSGVTLQVAGALNNDAAGKGQAAQVALSLGGRRTAITGFVGRRLGQEGGPDFTDFGGAFTHKVFGGPLVPLAVNLQAGAAYGAPSGDGVIFTAGSGSVAAAGGYGAGTHVWHVPVGLGISWVFPQPLVALKPWIAPRLDYVHVSQDGSGAGVTKFALSGGVSFGFLNGLGIDLSYDRVFVDGGSPASVGLGLRYTFP